MFPYLDGLRGRQDSTSNIQEAALRRARELNSEFNIYSDGSASAGTTNGGAGVVITSSDPADSTVITTLKARGAALTCSFEEEQRSMRMSIGWLEDNLTDRLTDRPKTDKLRYGPFTGLRAYKARVDRVSDPNCHLCGEGVPQTLEHWFQECPATEKRCRDLFGAQLSDLSCLSRYPIKAIALARNLLLGEVK